MVSGIFQNSPNDAAGAIVDVLIAHLNEASAMYQMFHFLYDVFVIDFEQGQIHHYKEIALDYLPEFFKAEFGSDKPLNFLTVGMEFGPHGEDVDTFRSDRANPVDGTKSSFLHPVLRYFSADAGKPIDVEAPVSMHHIPEDFVTEWHSRQETVPTLPELAQKWVGEGKSKVPPGGHQQLLDSYRHPIHVDPLVKFLQGSLSNTYTCEARHKTQQ